jgi:hypothetical protein
MKKTIYALTVFALCAVFSCQKDTNDLVADELAVVIKQDDCFGLDVNLEGDGVEKFIVEPLKKVDNCGCIVAGKVKYAKNGKTLMLLDYGNGECDNVVVKTYCIDGDCSSDKVKVCKQQMDCKPTVAVDCAGFDINLEGNGVEKIIVEPLKKVDNCGCIVAGLIKYVKNGKTLMLLDYGKGECDNIAVKTYCPDGDCTGNQAKVCKFEMDCKPGVVTDDCASLGSILQGDGVEKFIVEPLKQADNCGTCIVAGKVKYTKNGKTVMLMDFGNGECDNVVVKTYCIDGDCSSDKVKVCKELMDCK